MAPESTSAGLRDSSWESEVNSALADLYAALLAPEPPSADELSQWVLDRARQLTGSPIGFVGYIDPQTGSLICPTLVHGWDRCQVPNKTMVFSEFTGLCGWVLVNRQPVLTNCPARDPRCRGTPLGHAPIRRFLSAPAMAGATLVGQVALANADRDYDERDLALVGRLASFYAFAVQHQRAQEALRLTQFSVDRAADAVFWIGPDARLHYVNDATCRSLGYSRQELLSMTVHDFDPNYTPQVWPGHWEELKRRGSLTFETRHRRKDGQVFPVEVTANYVEYRGREYNIAFARDISERKRTEEEKQRLQAQLYRAQKMEALGQLAGGVAHDFNNILTAILGNTELLRGQFGPDLPADDPRRIHLEQLEHAAERAASLTRQMLAFSRRQVVSLEVLDLNQILRDMQIMLRRLITENIELVFMLGAEPALIQADAGQLEQVVLNLVVNARDAMPDGGRLIVETMNAELDQAYVSAHTESRPGPHVVLVISDTGCGMSPEILDRIFEPFFTTKPPGQGTGLGLATVYGVVKQAGGHVSVYSEPGRGSTFKVFLPAAELPLTRAATPAVDERELSGNETILICEDDQTVRLLTAQFLRQAGYRVLIAENAVEALRLAEQCSGPIDLLITDVIMPDLNGRQLSDALTAARPTLRTLFISGYTPNVIAHCGVLDPGVELLPKPFGRRALLERVRKVIGRPAG